MASTSTSTCCLGSTSLMKFPWSAGFASELCDAAALACALRQKSQVLCASAIDYIPTQMQKQPPVSTGWHRETASIRVWSVETQSRSDRSCVGKVPFSPVSRVFSSRFVPSRVMRKFLELPRESELPEMGSQSNQCSWDSHWFHSRQPLLHQSSGVWHQNNCCVAAYSILQQNSTDSNEMKLQGVASGSAGLRIVRETYWPEYNLNSRILKLLLYQL